MHVSANRDVCIGAGLCAMTAPAVFDQGDDGLVVVLTPNPDGGDQDAVRDAGNICPSGAIKITE
jgi:ferredoxin